MDKHANQKIQDSFQDLYNNKLKKPRLLYHGVLNLIENMDNNQMIFKQLEMVQFHKDDIIDMEDPLIQQMCKKFKKFNININCKIFNKKLEYEEQCDNYIKQLQQRFNVNNVINKDWICLPVLFKIISKMRNGEIHRLLMDLLNELKDKWDKTYLYNTNKNFLNCINLYKKYNIKTNLRMFNIKELKIKKFKQPNFEAEMFSQLNATVADARMTMGKVNEVCDTFNLVGQKVDAVIDNKIDKLCDKAEHISNKVDDFLERINKTITDVTNSCHNINPNYTNLILFFLKCLALAKLLTKEDNQSYDSILALITLIMPSNVFGYAASLGSGLARAIQGIISRFIGKFTTEANDYANENFIMSFMKITKGVISGMFTDIDTEKFMDMKIHNSKLKLFVDYTKNVTTLIDYFGKAINFIIEILGDQILNMYGFLPWFIKTDMITPYVDKYYEYKKMNKFDTCKMNVNHAKEIIELHGELCKIENEYVNMTHDKQQFKNIRILPYLRIMNSTLEKVIKNIPIHVKTGVNPRRLKPFWVYIFGEPRIGKSALFQPYLINELVRCLKLLPEYSDMANYSYYRELGAKWWDMYDGHLVTQYNDIFQAKSDDEGLNVSIAELTSIVDDQPYRLAVVNPDQINQVFFTSPIVVSNAQQDIVGQGFVLDRCWSNGEHLLARRNIVVELTLNDKYKLSGKRPGIDYNLMKQQMLKYPDEVVGDKEHPLFPTDMYILNFREKMTGQIYQRYGFEAGVAEIVKMCKEYFVFQDKFKTNLYAYMEKRWTEGEIEIERPISSVDNSPQKSLVMGDLPSNKQSDFKLVSSKLLPPIKTVSFQTQMYEPSGRSRTPSTISSYKDVTNKCICLNHLTTVESILKMPDNLVDKYFIALNGDHVCVNYNQLLNKIADEISTTEMYEDKDVIDNYYKLRNKRLCKCRNYLSDFLMAFDLDDNCVEKIKNIINDEQHICYKDKEDFFSKIMNIIDVDYQNTYLDSTLVKRFIDDFKDQLHNLQELCKNKLSLINSWINYEYVKLIGMTTLIPLIAMGTSFLVGKVINRAVKKGHTVQSAEGKITRPKMKNRRVLRKGNKTSIVATTEVYDDQNVVVENILINHFCRFALIDNNEKELMYGNGLAVGSNVFMMPKHYWIRFMQFKELYENNSNVLRIKLYWNKKSSTIVNFSNIKIYDPPHEHQEDTIYIQIKRLCVMKDIRKFFVSENDEVNFVGSYLYGLRGKHTETSYMVPTMLTVGNVAIKYVSYSSPIILDELYKQHIGATEFVNPYALLYEDNMTTKGDCGMLLMNSDSKLNCKKICGMHVAGSPNTHQGISTPVFKEDIDDAMDFFSIDDTLFFVEDASELINYQREPHSVLVDEVKLMGLRVEASTGTFINKNGVKQQIKLTMPRKSKISKSVVFEAMEEDFGPSKVKPAQLAKFVDVDGKEVSPMLNGLKKLVQNGAMMDEQDYEIIREHISNTIQQWDSDYLRMPKRLLNDDENINGFLHLNKLDLKTAPGFPWSLKNSNNGKLSWFIEKDGKFYMNDELQSIVKYREDLAKRGIIKETFFIDTMKDEPRPIEKVDKGKTRLFQVGPMDLSILMRKYFGLFIAHCHSTFLSGEIAIGVNCNSLDWSNKARLLKAMSNLFLNGDFSDYDASLIQQACMMVADIVNDFYDDGEVNALVRQILLATCLNTYHIVEDFIILILQGNPSGNVLTTILNCIVNMVFIRLFYIKNVRKDLLQFEQMVLSWFYGDDNLISVNEKIKHVLTMPNYQQFLYKYGMKYTSITKDEITQDHVYFQDLEFLKRNWCKHPHYNYYRAQLKLDTIMEIPRWSESDPTNMMDQMNRFNACLLELSNYGKTKFIEVRRKFVKYCNELRKYQLNINSNELFTFDICNEKLYPEFFVNDKLYHDLIDSFESKDGIVHGKGGDSDINKIGFNSLSRIDNFDNVLNFVANYETEMEEQENLPENPTTTASVETLTTFLDKNETHVHKVDKWLPNVFNYAVPPDLSIFLKRPYLAHQFYWTETDVAFTEVMNITLPDAILPFISDKINKIPFWRPSFEITIRVNATLMHYGRLVFYWFPQEKNVDSARFCSPYTAFTQRWYQVSANGHQSITFDIPYTSPFNYSNTYENTGPITPRISLANLHAVVAVPLSSSQPSTPSVEISVFCRVKDLGLAGYNYLPNFVVQMDDASHEAQSKTEEDKLISTKVQKFADFVSAFYVVPTIGVYAASSGVLLSGIASVLKYFGFDMSPNLKTPMPVWQRYPRYMQCEETTNTVLIGPVADCMVKKDFRLVNSFEHEMSILHFCSRPSLIHLGRITQTELSGDINFLMPICPRDMYLSTYDEPIITPYYGVPMQFVSRYFNYWRGGIRFHISFICSRFHSCRVRIVYVPFAKYNDATITIDEFTDCYNVVMDIIEETEYSFTIPFMQSTEWLSLPVNSYKSNTSGNYEALKTANGALYVQIINPLVSANNITAPIYYQLFASAAADMQFAQPTMDHIKDKGTFHLFDTEMDEVKSLQFPAVNMDCLMKKSYPCITNKNVGHVGHRIHMGNEITSLKQLCNMVSPLYVTTGSTALNQITFKLAGRIKLEENSGYNNFMLNMMTVYRYHRGGFRIVPASFINHLGYDYMAHTSTIPYVDNVNSDALTLSVGVANPLTVDNNLAMGYYIASDKIPADFTCPWYSSMNCRFNLFNNYNSWSDSNSMTITYYDTGNQTVLFNLGAADDFLLGFQIGIPSAYSLG